MTDAIELEEAPVWAELDQAGKDRELIRRYGAGESFEQLAELLGINWRGVARALHQARERHAMQVAIANRPPVPRKQIAEQEPAPARQLSGPRKAYADQMTPELERELLARRAKGERADELAEWLGCTRETLKRRVISAEKNHPSLAQELSARAQADSIENMATGGIAYSMMQDKDRDAEVLRRHLAGATNGDLVRWTGMDLKGVRRKLKMLLGKEPRQDGPLLIDLPEQPEPSDVSPTDEEAVPTGSPVQPRKSPKPRTKRARLNLTLEQQETILREHTNGRKTKDLAAEWNCTPQTINNYLRRARLAQAESTNEEAPVDDERIVMPPGVDAAAQDLAAIKEASGGLIGKAFDRTFGHTNEPCVLVPQLHDTTQGVETVQIVPDVHLEAGAPGGIQLGSNPPDRFTEPDHLREKYYGMRPRLSARLQEQFDAANKNRARRITDPAFFQPRHPGKPSLLDELAIYFGITDQDTPPDDDQPAPTDDVETEITRTTAPDTFTLSFANHHRPTQIRFEKNQIIITLTTEGDA